MMTEDTVVQRIKKWLEHNSFSIFLSGGKDSVATLLWVLDNIKNKNFNIIYVEVTGNTHEWCNYYVHYIIMQLGLEEKFLHLKRQDLDFFECLKKWGIPLIHRYRWCEYTFKRDVYKQHAYKLHVLGLRKEESKTRKHFQHYIYPSRKIPGAFIINPIFYWTKEQVIDYIKEHGIRMNPCYQRYGHGGNCMFCPYRTTEQIILTLQDSYWRDKIIKALKECDNKSPIGREIIKKWLDLAKQRTLIK